LSIGSCRKGFSFLYYLQTVAGGDEAFEAFMRDYLKTFANGNVDSNTFKKYYLDYFKVVVPLPSEYTLPEASHGSDITPAVCPPCCGGKA
jgi:hypothetical protein